MTLEEIKDYSDAAVRQLETTLQESPQFIDKKFVTTSSFKTIRELVTHMVGADERWTGRINGQIPETRYEVRAPVDISDVFSDWRQLRVVLDKILQDPVLIATTLDWQIPNGTTTRTLTVEQVVFHIFNHCTYHIGQISMLLQQFGEDPPNFDVPLISPHVKLWIE